jgi:hypothetical protein
MPGDLADLRRQLADVTDELVAMPTHLIGSEKHRDRVVECRWLTRTVNRLEGRDPAAN